MEYVIDFPSIFATLISNKSIIVLHFWVTFFEEYIRYKVFYIIIIIIIWYSVVTKLR